jgi:putative ABC transport system permease protein
MKANRLVQVALQSIRKNKMRTMLTMLGVVIGVGAVMVMVAVGQGATSQIRQRINNLGTNLIVITPGSASQAGVSRGAGSASRLTLEDAEILDRESYLLAAVSPVIVTMGQAVGGQGNWRANINGVSTDYIAIRDWDLASGRSFDEADVRGMRRVVLLGQTVARNLFPDADPIGLTLRLRDVTFEIIGVLAAKGQTAEGRDQDDVILAPYTTVQTRLAGRTFIAQIIGSASNPDEVAPAQEEVRAILRETHGLASYDEDDFTVRNQTELAEAAESTAEVMTLLLAAIASISLVVGGIGIMNIMLVSVTERTHEIGIRMAVGARGADVMTQFLVESIVMSCLGGMLGLALGFGGARVLGHFTGWSTAVAPGMIALAVGFSAAVGIFFGFYPARKAAALDPIQALRYE